MNHFIEGFVLSALVGSLAVAIIGRIVYEIYKVITTGFR